MVVLAPTVKLNNGKNMPVLGLGTWMLDRNQGKELIKAAIDVGYRHFDTALLYHSETVIGEAIREKIEDGTVKREDLFITSKLWCSYAHPHLVVKACQLSLKNLGLDYLDLYLIHWPLTFKAVENADEPVKADFNDIVSLFMIDEYFPKESSGKIITTDNDYIDTWKEMERCVQKGLTKSIGISNFNIDQIERLLQHATIKPAALQIEVHPYLIQKKLLKRCKELDILVTAYSPLGSPSFHQQSEIPKIIEHPTVLKISEKINKNPAQVILRFLVQLGISVIPKTNSSKRLLENISVFDFELTNEQMDEMELLNCNNRIFFIPGTEEHKFYPFKDD